MLLLLSILSNSASTSAMMESLAIALYGKVLGKTTQQALPLMKQNDIFLRLALTITGSEKSLAPRNGGQQSNIPRLRDYIGCEN